MSIASIAFRGAALVGKSACITAGVFVGTLAVGKTLEMIGRYQAGRDNDKPLGESIKDAFKSTSDAVKAAAEDTVHAVKKAADEARAEAAKKAAEAKPAVDAEVAPVPAAADAEEVHSNSPHILTWGELPQSEPLDYNLATRYLDHLVAIARTKGFTAPDFVATRMLENLYSESGVMQNKLSLLAWANSLHAQYTADFTTSTWGAAAIERAISKGYSGTVSALTQALSDFVYLTALRDPSQFFGIEVVDNWVDDFVFKANKKREEDDAKSEERVRAEVVIDQEAIDKRLGGDAAAIVNGTPAEDHRPTSPILPAEPVLPTEPAHEPVTASEPAAPAPLAEPAAKPTVTDADRKATQAAIDQASQAAADKAASRARRVGDTPSTKPGKK